MPAPPQSPNNLLNFFSMADVRHAALSLWRSRAFSTSVILTLALGIAVSAVMFCLLYGVLLRALPYPDAQALYLPNVSDRAGTLRAESFTPREAFDAVRGTRTAQNTGFYTWNGWTLQLERPESMTIVRVDPGFFTTLAVSPSRGRWFTSQDVQSDADPVAIVSERFVQRYLSSSKDPINQLVRFEHSSVRIVGVMPDSFDFPADLDVWAPLQELALRQDVSAYQSARFIEAVLRIDTQSNVDALQTELTTRLRALPAQDSAQVLEVAAIGLLDQRVGSVRAILQGLFLLALLVLLIAAFNAMNLITARGLTRLNVMAISQALGATRTRVTQQIMLEAAILAALAGMLAMLLAWLLFNGAISLAASGLPRREDIRLDAPVLYFAIAVALLSALLAASVPAYQITRSNIDALLRGGARVTKHLTLTKGVTISAIALSAAALIVALTLGINLYKLTRTELGFNPQGMLAVQLWPSAPKTPQQFSSAIAQDLAALPGVTAIGFSNVMPLGFIGGAQADVQADALAGSTLSSALRANVQVASPQFLQTLQTPLLQGEFFDALASQGERVAVINQTLATALFGAQSALGQQISLPDPDLSKNARWRYRVIGVHADFRNQSVAGRVQPTLLVPFGQYPHQSLVILLRSSVDADSLLRAVRSVIAQYDPQQGIFEMQRFSESIQSELAQPNFFASGAGWFAAAAVLLAMLGLYSLLAFELAQRAPERALKAALGASPSQLVRELLRYVATLGISGVILGALLAQLIRPLIDPALLGTTPWVTPTALASAALLLLLLAVAALHTRTVRNAPISALRNT
jgi:predicted permease